MRLSTRVTLLAFSASWVLGAVAQATDFDVTLRTRSVDAQSRLSVKHETQTWAAAETAVVICDMWDLHHCLNATRRVAELAPRINELLEVARSRGVTIIHAPSSCMDFYRDHPAREHVAQIPRAVHAPTDIGTWCYWKDPAEERIGYPIDHSDGGEDDDLEEHRRWAEQLAARGRDPGAPWKRQTPLIEIHDTDFITDDGIENWSILEHRGIKNVMLVGVHTNMCVLGRPFGLRQLAKNGKNVVLVRDLTDTMYNPKMRPQVSHFSGTDLVVEHIEQHVCPTISSDQLLGKGPFRFAQDHRPHVVMLIGEQEYETARTLPEFARKHLYATMKVSYLTPDADDPYRFSGIETVRQADVLLVSVRRRALPGEDLQIVREHVDAGRPVVGIRTASHAFSLRGEAPPPGHATWESFDAEVFGGNYQGHHGNKNDDDIKTFVWGTTAAETGGWPMIHAGETRTTSWLYKTSPLRPGANVLMMGRVGDRRPHEPVTWTYIHSGGGRSFYTSLGHPDDFQQPAFLALLKAGIEWSLQRSPATT